MIANYSLVKKEGSYHLLIWIINKLTNLMIHFITLVSKQNKCFNQIYLLWFNANTNIEKERKRKEQINNMIDKLFSRENIKNVYNIGKEVGQGKYGTIYLATKKFYSE